MNNHLILILLVLSLAGCYSEQEGCLDTKATNFDPEADKSCCCTYPTLKLDMLYKYDTLDFSIEQRYEHGIHDSFVVLDYGFIIRDFELQGSFDTLTIQDSTLFSIIQGNDTLERYLKDDLMLLGQKFNYTIGTMVETGIYSRLQANTGMEDVYHDIDPEELSGHALSGLQDKGHWEPAIGYDEAFLDVAYGANLEDTLRWVSGTTGFDTEIIIDGYFEKNVGTDLTIPLSFDFKAWLFEIDFGQTHDEVEKRLEEAILTKECLKVR